MGQSRKRSRSAANARQGGGATPSWAGWLGGAVVLALALWAGVSLLTLNGSDSRPESAAAPDTAHGEIDEASRQRLVEILREEEESSP